jgi:ABC-type branched-subunit amino acid transport system permease subunit
MSIFLGGLIAALFGILVGLPSLRIKGFYLIVSTLAAQFLFHGCLRSTVGLPITMLLALLLHRKWIF